MTKDNFTPPNDAPEGHKWQLSNGWEFKLLEVREDGCIEGAYKTANGYWCLSVHAPNGKGAQAAKAFDLIDAPSTHTVWVVFWRSERLGRVTCETFYEEPNFGTKGDKPLACIPVTFTEGEGL